MQAAIKNSCLDFVALEATDFRGKKTGPNPTDRRKAGSKHHVITDAQGVPLAASVTGANAHDVTQLLPLVEAMPSIGGKRGAPRTRPQRVLADQAYDSEQRREIASTDDFNIAKLLMLKQQGGWVST